MQDPLGQERSKNHLALWFTALLIAAAISGIAYAVFATYEHSSWFSGELRRFLNANEVAVFGGGAAALAVIIAVVFYRLGAFSRALDPTQGWGIVPAESGAGSASVSRVSSAFGRREGGAARIAVVMQRDRRACTGDLVLSERMLYFVCYSDKSLAKANAGKIAASQFGLLGALIQAIVASKGKKSEAVQLQKKRQEYSAFSLEEQISRNSYSLSLAPRDITLFSSTSLGGTRIEAGDKKYPLIEFDRGKLPAVAEWCKGHGVETKGF
jgi:hypothetical protein